MKQGLEASIQIGKNGFRPGMIENIKNCFKKRKRVKICVLKSAGHDKERVKEIASKIQAGLGEQYTYRIIGFTIFIKKWRKTRKTL